MHKVQRLKNKFNDIIWLKDAIDEILYKIKILESDQFQYNVTQKDNEKIIYFPGIPPSIIRKFKELKIVFPNKDNEIIKLTQLDDQRGYLFNTEIKLPIQGNCKIRNDNIYHEINGYISIKKSYVKNTIDNFLKSYRSTITKWRINVLKGQRNDIGDLSSEQLELKIIEGQAGTGKTHHIINQIDKHDGKVGIIVFGDGAIETYLERIGRDLNSLYVFSSYEMNTEYKNQIIDKIEEAKSSNEEISKLQDDWIDLISKFRNMSGFLSSFAPTVLIKEKDVSKFGNITNFMKLSSLFVDDSNQFHPWSILEIFPLSDNITLTGDITQLKAKKDYEFIVHRLGLPGDTLSMSLPESEELLKIPRVKMDLDEELSLSIFISGNIRRLAKTFQSGLTFPELNLDNNLGEDIETRLQEVKKLKERSLFQITKKWPVKGIKQKKLYEFHRYIGTYKSLLKKLGVIEGSSYSTINREDVFKLGEEIFLPVTFIDFPMEDLEDKRYWDNSKYNMKEVTRIKKIVENLIKKTDKSILITSGYGEQTKRLQNKLKNLVLNSNNQITILHVDFTSSLERDIVIISLTRNNVTRNIGHLEDNRISMMLKRAREGVIVIGSSETFVFPGRRNPKNSVQRKIIKNLREEADRLDTYKLITGGNEDE